MTRLSGKSLFDPFVQVLAVERMYWKNPFVQVLAVERMYWKNSTSW